MAGTALTWRKSSGSGQGNLGVNGFWTQVLVIWSRRTGQSWSEWSLTFRNLATGRRTSWTIASLHEKSIMDQGWQMVLSNMYNTHLALHKQYVVLASCIVCLFGDDFYSVKIYCTTMPGKYMNRSLILNQAQSSCMKIPLLTGYPWITLPEGCEGRSQEAPASGPQDIYFLY